MSFYHAFVLSCVRCPLLSSPAFGEKRASPVFALSLIHILSLKDIGSEFSGRDHSTVSYAIRTIVERMEEDMHLEETVEDIIKNVRT